MPLSSHHKTGACAHAQCLYCMKNFRVLQPLRCIAKLVAKHAGAALA